MGGSWIDRLNGAAEGTRTPDPIITNDVLYQLSYCGAGGNIVFSPPACKVGAGPLVAELVWRPVSLALRGR